MNHEFVCSLAIILIPRLQHRTRGDFHWFSGHCSIQALCFFGLSKRQTNSDSKKQNLVNKWGLLPYTALSIYSLAHAKALLFCASECNLSRIQCRYRILLSPHACDHCLHRDRGFFRPKCHHLDSRQSHSRATNNSESDETTTSEIVRTPQSSNFKKGKKSHNKFTTSKTAERTLKISQHMQYSI